MFLIELTSIRISMDLCSAKLSKLFHSAAHVHAKREQAKASIMMLRNRAGESMMAAFELASAGPVNPSV
jgi:hypothetical protein